MLPNNALSPQPIPAPFVEPQTDLDTPLVDVEMGGAGLHDATGGLRQKLWTAYMDGDTVMVTADGVPPVALFAHAGITLLSLAFDQLMQPFVAFTDGNGAHYWWYDPTVPGFTVGDLPAGATDPRCSLDDKRPGGVAESDIILAYILGGSLCMRVQRERYAVEHVLRADVGGRLVCIGFGAQGRFQFAIDPA